MSIDASKLQVDSRDYLSIYQDLMNARPNLTKLWNTEDENDPGVVLVKLAAMYGDMLSYNHDRAVLECYPATVTQRKNANQVFGLLGYKMHWYQSAKCSAAIINSYSSSVQLPRLATFVTPSNITYTYVDSQITLPTNTQKDITLVQGVPRTPNLRRDTMIPVGSEAWFEVYDYNVYAEDIILGNKIYISDSNIDEDNIILVDDAGNTWTQIAEVNSSVYAGRYFSLQIDDYNKPYLELPTYWENFSVSKFRLFYLVSLGMEGQINQGMLTPLYQFIANTPDGDVNVTKNVSVVNNQSTYGYNYETPEEARENYADYVGTFDTLVTISDFEKVARRLLYVANCKATDIVTDPHPTEYEDSNNDPIPDGEAMANNTIRLNVTKSSIAETLPESTIRDAIKAEINKNKLMLLDIKVLFNTLTYYNWQVNCVLYLKEKVDTNTATNVVVAVRNLIATTYSKENMEYNQIIGYPGLLDTIYAASPLISSVDLGTGISYLLKEYDGDGNLINIRTGVTTDEITGIYYSSVTQSPSLTYSTTLPNVPIKKTTLVINVDNNRFTIYDDGKGNLLSDSIMFISGTIDYDTGDLAISFASNQTKLEINYEKNVINMVLPDQPLNFRVAESNIKR